MLTIVLAIALFLITVILHEVAHGLVAYGLGDPTAKQAGRLTLNPIKHIDPFWTVLFPGILFFSTGGRFAIGMAKPVPVDFGRLRYQRVGMIAVALAGPLTNLVLAYVFMKLFKSTEMTLFLIAVYFNLGLAFFNLIPIPPMDGSRVLTGLLPNRWAYYYLSVEKFGFIIILVLYMTGFLFSLILPAVNFFCLEWNLPQIRFR